jgi:hypothetical protein
VLGEVNIKDSSAKASESHSESLINKEARAENQRANLQSKIKT